MNRINGIHRIVFVVFQDVSTIFGSEIDGIGLTCHRISLNTLNQTSRKNKPIRLDPIHIPLQRQQFIMQTKFHVCDSIASWVNPQIDIFKQSTFKVIIYDTRTKIQINLGPFSTQISVASTIKR